MGKNKIIIIDVKNILPPEADKVFYNESLISIENNIMPDDVVEDYWLK